MRQLARVVMIDDVRPHPNADRLDVVSVGGWRIVTRKGDFLATEKAVFLETDAFLPASDPHWHEFCSKGTKTCQNVLGYPVKTTKVRGIVSQGLLFKPSELGLGDPEIGLDLTETLGILKWDPSETGPKFVRGDAAGTFPSHLVQKTDADRVQNLDPEWFSRLNSIEWYATEKVDGTSLTVIRADRVYVCSRNQEIKEGDNTYWNAARILLKYMPEQSAVQAEIFGNGIQGNPLKVEGKELTVFNYFNLAAGPEPQNRFKWPTDILDWAASSLNLSFPGSILEAIEQVDGMRSLINDEVQAEGVVWHHKFGQTFHQLNGRACFKVINNEYLLRKK